MTGRSPGFIRSVEHGIIVPIPPDQTTPLPLGTGVLTEKLEHVPECITWRGGIRWTFDPVLPKPGEIIDKPGRALFAGPLYGHFGHFLVESTARLWALPRLSEKIDQIAFVPRVQIRQDRVLKTYQAFFDLLDIKFPIVNLTEPTRFDRVYVPQQGFGMFGMVEGLAEYRAFMRSRIEQSVAPEGGRRLYVSRSDLSRGRGGLLGEGLIERALADEGYAIFHPQNHSFEQQLAAYRAADFIISPDGSPLHMAALAARPTTKVAVIARRPNVAAQFDLQFRAFCGIAPLIINAVRCHWIPDGAISPDRLSFGELDFDRVRDALVSHDFIKGTFWRDVSRSKCDQLVCELEERQNKRFHRFQPLKSP